QRILPPRRARARPDRRQHRAHLPPRRCRHRAARRSHARDGRLALRAAGGRTSRTGERNPRAIGPRNAGASDKELQNRTEETLMSTPPEEKPRFPNPYDPDFDEQMTSRIQKERGKMEPGQRALRPSDAATVIILRRGARAAELLMGKRHAG